MNKIKQMREDRGMSQRDLAERIGMSQAAVAFWEMGHVKPCLSSVGKLAAAFGVSLEEMAKLVS